MRHQIPNLKEKKKRKLILKVKSHICLCETFSLKYLLLLLWAFTSDLGLGLSYFKVENDCMIISQVEESQNYFSRDSLSEVAWVYFSSEDFWEGRYPSACIWRAGAVNCPVFSSPGVESIACSPYT